MLTGRLRSSRWKCHIGFRLSKKRGGTMVNKLCGRGKTKQSYGRLMRGTKVWVIGF